MKQSKTKFWPLIISAIIVIAFVMLKFSQIGQPEQENITPPLNNSLSNIENLVQDYLNNHITELSPEPAVLGGTFYITNTTFLDNNRILIEYEDGHISYTARAQYEISPNQPLTISNFELVKINEELINPPTAQVGNDNLAVVAVKNDLAQKYNKDFSEIDLVVEYEDKYHLRGTVSLGSGSENSGIFLATMIDGEFKVVFDGNGAFDCQNLLTYNFPATMLPECLE